MIRRRLSVLLASCVGLMALADWLFYGQPAGWTFALFFLAAAMLVTLKGGAHLRGLPGAAAIAAVLGLLAALVIQPGPLVVVMCVLSIAVLAILAREPLPQDAAALTLRLLVFALKSPLQWVLDVRPLRRIFQRRQFGTPGKSILNWTLPIAGSMLFLGLFAVANPLLSLELDIWGQKLQGFFAGISLSPSRAFFWALTGLCTWALLRVRTLVARRAAVPPQPHAMSVARASMLVRCLALFNVIFLVQTVLDVTYLFGGLQLPQGMTYAEYAHRGAYPLVATALLAATFVLSAYRSGPATRETAAARRLVLLWIAQNIFLTFSAAWRLHLYTNVYSLTRLRVAAGIWMLLVALGLAWIGLRIAAGRSNRWLVSRNLATISIVLYACCFVNFEGAIAWHNVRHCRELGGIGTTVDYGYLNDLGEEAVPALLWMKQRGYPAPSDALEAQQTRLAGLHGNWRAWTYRRMKLWDESLPQYARFR